MAKKRTSLARAPHQLLLPLGTSGTNTIRAGRLGRHEALREALTSALANCPLSREEFAAEMSRLTGESLSVNHINNWASSAKKDWRFPMEFAAAFCLVAGDFGLFEAALDGTGRELADEESRVLAEYGRVLVAKKRAACKERELLEKLGA
jgi:hypothetical protein